MVVLRATQKVLRALPPKTTDAVPSDTALGDWYVNRFVVDRKPLLLLVSSQSLLALVTPARDVRALPDRLAGLVGDRLRRLGVGAALCDAEIAAMQPVHVGATKDRSVLGSAVEFAKAIPYYLPIGGWDEGTLPFLETRLAETPCRLSGRFENTLFPEQRAPELLKAKWLDASPNPSEIAPRSVPPHAV
jgi:hypothetical protein